jgi:hypothetical protein
LATALLNGKPTKYLYLRVNKKDVQALTIARLKGGYSVAWLDPETKVRTIRFYDDQAVTLFRFNNKKKSSSRTNDRATKVSITITGKYQEEKL